MLVNRKRLEFSRGQIRFLVQIRVAWLSSTFGVLRELSDGSITAGVRGCGISNTGCLSCGISTTVALGAHSDVKSRTLQCPHVGWGCLL